MGSVGEKGKGRKGKGHLDKGGITNAKLCAFMRRGHLIGAQVYCWQQVLRCGCNDRPEAVHLQGH